jgi:multiple sugar transport system permease protein
MPAPLPLGQIEERGAARVVGGNYKDGGAPGRVQLQLPPVAWFAPVLVLLLVVTVYPTGFVIWMSFQKTKFYDLVGFVGLKNYVELFGSSEFWDTTTTSLIYVGGSLAISLMIGLGAALVLNAVGRAGRTFRILIIFPWTLSMSVVASIWLWLLNPSFGPVSYAMRQLGVEPGLMLGDLALALPLTILVTSWWSFPYVMVLLTAAMQSIPQELFEAVEIDGGGAVVTFRYVTLPHIMPAVASTALTLAIFYLTLVTLIIVLTGGGPLGFEAFRGSVQAVDIAPTAVISLVILVINIVLGGIYTRLTGRITG